MGEFEYGSKKYYEKTEGYFDLINQKLAGASRVQARILGLDVMPRLMVCLEWNECSCAVCKSYLSDLHTLIESLPEVVAGRDVSERRSFEKLGKEVFDHLKNSHGMSPKGRKFASISLIAMLIGMFIGFLLSVANIIGSWGGGIMLGWLLGMLFGGIIGKVTEERLRKKNLLF